MKKIFAAMFSLIACFSKGYAQEDTTLKATVETTEEAKPSAASAPAAANSAGGFTDVVCTNGSNKRIVELITAASENKLPCEVHYKKETEQPGHDQVIYTANSDLSFCHAKASAFVDKLNGMGWACSAK